MLRNRKIRMTKPLVIALRLSFCLAVGILTIKPEPVMASDIYVQSQADLVPAEQPIRAQTQAKARIEALNTALLAAMTGGDSLGYTGRYEVLAPVIQETYNLPLMAQLAIGRSAWDRLSVDEQGQLVDRFTGMSIAAYAARFNQFTDQHFSVNGIDSGPQKTLIVNSKLEFNQKDSVNFAYVMRDSATGWRIVDVFINGQYSELSRRRAEFASVIRNGGLNALLARIDEIITDYQTEAEQAG